MTDAFSLLFGYLAPLQTLWEHFLCWVFVKERPHTILQKASPGLWDLLRGAPRLILLLFPLPPSTSPSSPLSYSSRQKTVCLCHTLMCTIAGRRHAESCTLAPSSGGRSQWTHRSHVIEMWRECLYLFLCLCYPCGLPENSEGFSFSRIHVVIVAWHCLQLRWGCFVSSKQFGKSGAERSARHCSFVIIIIMLLKITAAL